MARNLGNCTMMNREPHFQLQDRYFTELEKVYRAVLLFPLKVHSGPRTPQPHLARTKLHLGDKPSAARWTLPRKWEHSFGNNSNCQGPYDTQENFFPSDFIFYLIHFPFYFAPKIAAQISGGTTAVGKAFYLLSASAICTSPYAADTPGNRNDLQKGGLREQPQPQAEAPKLRKGPENGNMGL